MIPPCKGCEYRCPKPNCHATCEAYKAYVTERNQINEQKRKDSVIFEYLKYRTNKEKRR